MYKFLIEEPDNSFDSHLSLNLILSQPSVKKCLESTKMCRVFVSVSVGNKV